MFRYFGIDGDANEDGDDEKYTLLMTWLFTKINLLRPSDVFIYVGKLSIIGSNNGLSPSRRQAIIWTNVGLLLIGTPGTNFSEISIEIYTFSFKKMHLKMSSGKWRPCCLGLNVSTVLLKHAAVLCLKSTAGNEMSARIYI